MKWSNKSRPAQKKSVSISKDKKVSRNSPIRDISHFLLGVAVLAGPILILTLLKEMFK